MDKITNSGEMRAFLCNMIHDVEQGKITAETARSIIKVSAQVNESLYSEVKVAKTQVELGEQAAKFGKLSLGIE